MNVRFLHIHFLMAFSFSLLSQNQNNQWYFGYGAALNFNTNPPTALSVSSMSTFYGSSSISDNAGNLLFYTNGATVWNQSHSIMGNGTGIFGFEWAGSGSIILKKPGSSNLFYLFTVQSPTIGINFNLGPGFNYSVIDMNLASGQGSVAVKNASVYPLPCEGKITATKHCNGTDYWVLIKEYNYGSNVFNFRAYQFSATGINTLAVVSTFSNHPSASNGFGEMNIARDGKKLAYCTGTYDGLFINNNIPLIEVFDFDNSTGIVSNSLALQYAVPNYTNGTYGYGVEFSPDCTKLFGCSYSAGAINNCKLLQWDLCAGSNNNIVSSQAAIYTSTIINLSFGNMQLAPNGKIYCSQLIGTNTNSICVINSPNVYGLGCNYVPYSQSISPGTLRLGLPNFANSIFVPHPAPAPFTYTASNTIGCQMAQFAPPAINNVTIAGCASTGYSLTNVLWNFGDPASGANNTTIQNNPTHTYPTLGTYTVQLILYYSCGGGTDTLRQQVNITQNCLSVNSTSITCANLGSATVIPQAGLGPYTYTWLPTNQTGSVALGLNPGTHTILFSSPLSNYIYTTTSSFTSLIPLTGNFNNSASITCNGASTGTAAYSNLAGGSGNQNYLWSNGLNTYTVPNPNTLSAGLWSSTVTDALTGCSITNLFFITQPPPLIVNLSANTPSACAGSSITLSATVSGGTANYTFAWVAGSNSSTNTVSQNIAGTYNYSLSVYDSYSCSITQSLSVNFIPNPILTLNSASICPLEVGTLTVSGATSYTWSNNTTGNTFTASPAVSTQYSVIGSALSCTAVNSAFIVIKPLPNPIISSNSPVCEAATLSLSCNSGTAYVWSGVNAFSSLSQNNTINPVNLNHAGLYNVTLTAANSCTASTSATVIVKPLPTLTISPNSPSICANTTSVALNAIGTATLFNWQPNQNLSATNTQSVLAYPNSTQVYTLTGSLNGCILQKTVAVNVLPPPNPLITLSSPSACAQALNSSPNTITLTLSGANTYTLNAPNYFNNPNPSGPNSPISLLPPYQATGLSTATLYGSNGVCTISSTAVFTIIANPTVSINSYTPIICAGQSFTYINSGASFYTWSSSTPGQTLNATGNVAVVSPSISSVFSVFGSSLGCYSALQTSSITVNPLPIVSISPNPTFVCLGSEVALIAAGTGTFYTWQPPNYLNTTTGAQVNANPPQQINYTVISALNNCTNSAVVTISVMPLPTPSITANTTTLCLNQKLILQGFGGTSYSWLLPNNSILTSQTMTLMVNNSMYSGTYTLMVSDANACVNSATTTIKVENLPSGYLNYNNSLNNCVPFCNNYTFVPSGATTTLSSNINQFNWQINNQSVSTQNRFSYCFINAGVYVVKGDLTSDLGCTNSVTMQIIAYPKPIADFTYSPEHPLENMEEVSFLNTGKDQNIKTFNWLFMFDKTEYSSNQINPSFLFENAGTYSVALIVTNDYQCKDTLIKTITVASDFAVYVPNTFSPNQDNKNEIFNAVTRGVNKYSIQIFNRWGQKVFESNDLNNGWDGTFKGQVCQSGVYGWKISASSYDGMLKELTGQVMVYR